MHADETIAAIATPPGVAAVAVLRVSGSGARAVADACFTAARPGPLRPAYMRRGWVRDPKSGARLDDALAVLFASPHSYTGEDVLELHVHGGAGVVGACLAHVLSAGARLAAPGEFTRRAFVNGRLDLAQAEAVADLIDAQSQAAAAAAAARLEGALGRALTEQRDELLAGLVEIEAHVDYPDEVPEPSSTALTRTIAAQRERIDALLGDSGATRALNEGIECAIAGPPNAGKSSLLNALVEAERAIVSEIPGTTRDIVEDRVVVDGVTLRLRDTAGLRAAHDVIEIEGVARARRAIERAELVILVIDGSGPLGSDAREALERTAGRPRIVLCNKLDLGDVGRRQLADLDGALIAGSVRWPDTIRAIRSEIARLGWGGGIIDAQRALVANARQVDALTRARGALERAGETIERCMPVDMLAIDLRAAIAAYGEVTGETVTDAVLDGIFSRFCVGK